MTRERADVGSYDDIVAAAQRTTGLTDFGGTAHEEGLRILAEDLASPEAGLTPRGNYFQRSEVKSALVGVLLTTAAFDRHPEHADVPIQRPVFVMGLPRTGTTALHRLLHADPVAQGLEMWLTQFPQPRPPRDTWDDDPIFAAMQQAFAAHHVESPEFMGIHYMDATTVEECWRLLRQTGKSNSYESLATHPALHRLAAAAGLDRRLRAAPAEPPARRAQRPREAVGAQEPEPHDRARRADDRLSRRPRRLHPPRPGGVHRVVVLAVGGDDGGALHHLHPRDDRPHPARPVVARLPRLPRRPAALRRRAVRRGRVRRPVADPLAVVRRVYEQFGLDLTPEALAAVEEIDRESKQGGKKPSHRYSLGDYGLTEHDVQEAFDR